MSMNLEEFFWRAIPVGFAGAIILGIYRFYRRHILDIELYAKADDSYCYVLDSERNQSREKAMYYAQLKATVDISAGASLGLEDVYFILKDGGERCQVEFSAPSAPENVRKFFKGFGNGWETQDPASNKRRWTARGVAMKTSPFEHRPAGVYHVDMVFVFKRFSMLLPCSFANLKEDFSTIDSEGSVSVVFGGNVDPIALSEKQDNAPNRNEGLYRLQFAILDLDFLPRLSLFKVFLLKKTKLQRPPDQ